MGEEISGELGEDSLPCFQILASKGAFDLKGINSALL